MEPYQIVLLCAIAFLIVAVIITVLLLMCLKKQKRVVREAKNSKPKPKEKRTNLQSTTFNQKAAPNTTKKPISKTRNPTQASHISIVNGSKALDWNPSIQAIQIDTPTPPRAEIKKWRKERLANLEKDKKGKLESGYFQLEDKDDTLSDSELD
uniref:Uncharacterized protein n=1 Tax=Acrobeloides nanus TaxID=290746 RepID=A0A914DNW7_9BILA